MKKLSKKEWVAVGVSLAVVLLFFTTGHTLVSFFSNAAQNDAALDKNNDPQNMQPTDNSFSSSVAGFEIIDITNGTGDVAEAGKVLTVNYSGAFTDGRVFDSSYERGTPFEFTLGAGQVIPGWEKGFTGMKVGGKRRLVLPPEFAYGPQGVPGFIPPNSVLVFEVELLGVR